MERTIYDIMSDSPAKVAEFVNACDDMLAAQYILADSKVEAILKTIATSKLLYSLFNKILAKFDYKLVAKSCIRENAARVQLPNSAADTASLVFCLLIDIDKRNIELKDFLQFYRQEQDSALAYKYFLKDFIEPFKNATLTLIESNKNAEAERRKADEVENERRRMERNLEKFLSSIVARINADDNLDTIIKDNLTVLCGQFLDAVRNNDKKSHEICLHLIKKLRLYATPLAKELEIFDINA